MLVLSRRVGESVMIGDDITVTVLEVRGDIVRLGIDAPRDVKVHREEVYREVEASNRAAAGNSSEVTAAAGLARLPKPSLRYAAPAVVAPQSDRPGAE